MTDSENDEILRIIGAFNRNVSRIEKCLRADLKEEAIILVVSTFEVLLKDLFILKRSRWFSHASDPSPLPSFLQTPKIRKHIRNYLEKIKAYDEFIKIQYIYSGVHDNPDIKSLCEVLIRQGKINFQNLTKENGVSAAYKIFFDIYLSKSLDENSSTSDRIWEKLNKLFDERHEIVHRSKGTTFSEEDIRTVLNSIKYLMKYLTNKLGPYQRSEGGCINYFEKQ